MNSNRKHFIRFQFTTLIEYHALLLVLLLTSAFLVSWQQY